MRLPTLFFLGFFPTFGAVAQTDDVANVIARLETDVVAEITASPEAMIGHYENILRRVGQDGVLTRSAVEEVARLEQAAARGQKIGQILGIDLDGDLSVDRAELDLARRHPLFSGTALRQLGGTGIGDVTPPLLLAEILELAGSGPLRRRQADKLEALMGFDVNGDDRVDTTEIASVIKRIGETVSPPAPTRSSRPEPPVCTMPTLPADGRAILVQAEMGGGLSDVAVGPSAKVTTTVPLLIDAGEEELHLILTSPTSVVWRLGGATDRVATVVMLRQGKDGVADSGVTGIPSERVGHAIYEACIGRQVFQHADDGRATVARGRLATHIERPVDQVIAERQIIRLSLPTGRSSGLPASARTAGMSFTVNGRTWQFTASGDPVEIKRERAMPADKLEAALHRAYPSGLVRIDPSAVVSNVETARYDVLPAEAGLIQLLENETLTVTPDGFYRIVKAVSALPAGLYGQSAVGFLLAEGLPIPTGVDEVSPGGSLGSKIYDVTTGACVAGRCNLR